MNLWFYYFFSNLLFFLSSWLHRTCIFSTFFYMAFNVQTFKTRSLTAVVFVVVMLAGLLVNYDTFFALFSIVHFGCWFEYYKLIDKIDSNYGQVPFLPRLATALLGWSFLFLFSKELWMVQTGEWLFYITLGFVAASLLIYRKTLSPKNIGYMFLGLLYISLAWTAMISLRSALLLPATDGRTIPLVLIASIWINDTMAYIVGSLIGKTPFSSISPKKTWEGTAGGALLAVVVMTAVCYFGFDLPAIPVFIISAIAAVMGTLGDLLESKLKRMADVKDSGSIMPGHGGFLDRFDSLLLATPFVWLYVAFAV